MSNRNNGNSNMRVIVDGIVYGFQHHGGINTYFNEVLPDQYKDELGQRFRRQYREHLRRATRIIAISEKTKKDVIRFYNIDPSIIDVVHLATNREIFWPEQNWKRLNSVNGTMRMGEPYVVYVGGRWS